MKSGKLLRKDNSLIFETKSEKITIPVNSVDSIFLFGEVNLNTKLLNFLSRNEIALYIFNYYGFYSGTYAPRKQAVSGKLLVEQVKHYIDPVLRLGLAKEIVLSSVHNMRKTLMQYNLEDSVKKFESYRKRIKNAPSINYLMLIEAEAKESYFRQFNKIIKYENFYFLKRTRFPPNNFINTLISFGNSLLYNTVLSEIFKTQLDPTISFLHEPFERRYSLNLDLADIFKSLIVDRVIFSLINRNQINPEHFDKKLNYCYLNKDGRKLFLKEYDLKLKTSIKYPRLNRKVSYKYILRLECYKLIKFFLEKKPYKGFRIYW